MQTDDQALIIQSVPFAKIAALLQGGELQRRVTDFMLARFGEILERAQVFTDVVAHAKVAGLGLALLSAAWSQAADPGNCIQVMEVTCIQDHHRVSIPSNQVCVLIAICPPGAAKMYSIVTWSRATGDWEIFGQDAGKDNFYALVEPVESNAGNRDNGAACKHLPPLLIDAARIIQNAAS